MTKTHQSAVVLVPPEELWGPIQAIRRKYDRKVERWMPHVTLLYPFWPERAFDEAAVLLQQAVAMLPPFQVCLAELTYFDHGRDSYTMWFAPEPKEAIANLQASLQAAIPECSDVSGHRHGFTPHLSVGQAQGSHQLQTRLNEIRRSWMPLEFDLKEVTLLARGAGTPFSAKRAVRLGAPA